MLERMRTLGFWPKGEGLPPDPPEEAAERARIEAELAELRKKQADDQGPREGPGRGAQAPLGGEQEAPRRGQGPARSTEQRLRREAWDGHRRPRSSTPAPASARGLQDTRSDAAALTRRGLPVLHTAADLAAAIGIELKALRWLTYHRRGAALVHYHRYEIAKKTGGVRCISAPKPALARAQHWVLRQHPRAGWRPSRRPTASSPAGRSSPTPPRTPAGGRRQPRPEGLLPLDHLPPRQGPVPQLGYGEHVATLLALLCTEPPRVPAELDGKTYHVALGDRVLPQGACTSPAITNALCRRLDRRLAGLARRHGFAYTRYADDLTFSGDTPAVRGPPAPQRPLDPPGRGPHRAPAQDAA